MVTKDTFLNYYEAQQSGQFNMIMDANLVMSIWHIEKEDYLDIIKNYNKYYKQFIKN